MKYFVTSDIHSFYDAMITALTNQGFDKENSEHCLIVCGDLFDRGPDTRKVFEFVSDLSKRNRLIYIAGNHEELLFDCINEIYGGRGISSHHMTNGTFDTIVQFTGLNKYELTWGIDIGTFREKINPLISFIEDKCVDCCEIGEYVCVHGWIPFNPFSGRVDENWRDGDWSAARWFNGMSAWHKGARLENKTIVCGHWHASWGHSHLHRDRKEFPQKNRIDWQKSFEPFIDNGIIALDACTAYTGFCNCFVIEV